MTDAPIFLVHLQRQRDPCTRLTRMDYTPLLDPCTSMLFAEKVTLSFGTKSPSHVTHSHLTDALSKTATPILSKLARAVPLWFASSGDIHRAYIDRRNKAFDHSQRIPTPLSG